MNILKVLVVFVFIFISFEAVHAKSIKVSKPDFGDDWPFTINEGELARSDRKITFRSGEILYEINGTASSAGYASIDPIWKFNMKLIEGTAKAFDLTIDEAKEETPFRLSIAPTIKAGLELCNN